MSDRIRLTVSDRIATVTLTRGDKRNALDLDMLTALSDTGTALMTRTDIRAVVLTGEGPAFSAGLDTATFPKLIAAVTTSGGLDARTHGDSNLFQHAAMVWADLPVPVIAALHGYAFGGGFQIMLGADIRIATPDCRFSVMEGKWGLIPDMGGMALMPRLARGDVIRRLTYTAEVFNAGQAQEWGFVTELANDSLGRANALARDIAANSPDTVRAAKSLIRETERLPDTATILMRETEAQLGLIGTLNQTEAVMAGFEGRTPVYKDPE